MPRVLVVDDDPEIVENTTDFLRIEDWDVDSAFNGQEALNILGPSFDAVILDLRMPIMDGERTLLEIRKRFGLEGVCVVILTAFGEVGSAVKAIRQGAYQYLEKPFELPDLQRILISGIAMQKAHSFRRELLVSFDIDNLLDNICSIIAETINPEGLYVIFLEPDASNLRVRSGFQTVEQQYSIRKSDGTQRRFVQHIIDSKQHVFEDDEVRIGGWEPILGDAKSLLAVPVYGTDGSIVGIIDMESRVKGAFDRNWVEVLCYLSDLAGIAIEIADKAQRNAELLGERAHWQKMPILVRELGHQILTPVQVISMQAQTLKDKELKSEELSKLPNELVSAITRRIDVIGENAETIARVCDYLRDVSKDIPVSKERFDLVEVLETCIEEYLSELDDIGIDLDFSDKPAGSVIIEADPGLIKYSVQCVINNAIEAIQRRREQKAAEGEESIDAEKTGDCIKITLNIDESNERVCLAIQDTGIGILPEHLDRIFEPLFTTKGVEALSGMGLFSVNRIINEHEGLIKVESDYGHGATFTICLPLKKAVCSGQLQPTDESHKEQEG